MTFATERVAQRRRLAGARFNAFTSVTGDQGPGPKVAIKDLIDVAGLPTTSGSPRAVSPAAMDAPTVARLRAAGAVIVAKANLYEWGYGVTSENRTFGDVRNPRALDHSAGGSSGGCAAAVAAGLCDWGVGTDTAGSVRIPAALCGIVGFKPTYGVLSTAGVQGLSPSQDTIGVLTQSVDAARAAFEALGGPARAARVTRPLGLRLRLAVPGDWVHELDERTAAAWSSVARQLPVVDLVARTELFELAVCLQGFEAAQIHAAALRDDPGRYHPDVRQRIEAALAIDATAAAHAKQRLHAHAERVDEALEEIDVLALPTTACVAPKLAGAPDMREPLTRFTRPFNGTGHPAISLPLPAADLPVGLQLVGRRGEDARLLLAAERIERALRREHTLAAA